MRSVWTVCVLTLVAATSSQATVLLDETFSGSSLDTSAWATLAALPGGRSVAVDVADGQMTVVLGAGGDESKYAGAGIRSIHPFAVGSGQTLVVDWYGTNYANWSPSANSQESYPMLAVTPMAITGYADDRYTSNIVSLNGASQWTEDCMYGAIGYGLGSLTYGQTKHVIHTISDSTIDVYIADDAYENLVSPVPLKSVATSSVYSTDALRNGLYVFTGMQTYSGGTTWEQFDGVRVSMVPEPTSVILFVAGGVAALRRRAM
jgi:hypothetical protein